MNKDRLKILDSEISSRCKVVHQQKADWPCRAGCAQCCKTLKEPMQVTEPEWRRLQSAIDKLESTDYENVMQGLDIWSKVEAGVEHICPMLGSDDRCLVYDARPIACRTYGYYVASDGQGRWCSIIEARDDLHEVIWGYERSLRTENNLICLSDWLGLIKNY